MNRLECLEAAIGAVCNDREDTHGDPHESFQNVADMWSMVAKTEIRPWQVCLMLAQMKIGRIVDGDRRHADHYVDAAGYVALAVELITERKN